MASLAAYGLSEGPPTTLLPGLYLFVATRSFALANGAPIEPTFMMTFHEERACSTLAHLMWLRRSTRHLLPHLHQRVQKKVLLGTSPARVLTCCYLGDGATAELTEALLDRALTASVWRRAAPQHQVGACSQRPRVGATSCATRAALERFTHSRRIDSPQP